MLLSDCSTLGVSSSTLPSANAKSSSFVRNPSCLATSSPLSTRMNEGGLRDAVDITLGPHDFGIRMIDLNTVLPDGRCHLVKQRGFALAVGTPGYEELDHDATGGIVDLLLPGLLVFYLHDYIAIEYILHGESPLSDDAALVCAC